MRNTLSASTLLAVPVSSVRTDKPEPYVQVVENTKVVHQRVTLGARGTVEAAGQVAIYPQTTGAITEVYVDDGTLVRTKTIDANRDGRYDSPASAILPA